MPKLWSEWAELDQEIGESSPIVRLVFNPRYGHLAIALNTHDETWVAYCAQNYVETHGEIGMIAPPNETLDSFADRCRTF